MNKDLYRSVEHKMQRECARVMRNCDYDLIWTWDDEQRSIWINLSCGTIDTSTILTYDQINKFSEGWELKVEELITDGCMNLDQKLVV